LPELMRASGETPITFVCPASVDTPAGGADADAQAKNLTSGGHLSYVYLGKGLVEPVADAEHLVVAYERQAFHGKAGMNVLFADGHIETLPPPNAASLTATARGTTGPILWPPRRSSSMK